jgi:Glyoxalase-like domain
MAVPVQITFDTHDPDRVARFWAELLGYEIPPPPPGFDSWPAWLAAHGVPEAEWDSASAIEDPAGVGPRFFFQKVPEDKVVKNRVHLDVNIGGPRETSDEERRANVAAGVERAIGAGATLVEEREKNGEHWVIMQDPEGNEFCLQ